MDTNVKTGLFPFEDVKETMSLDPEREALVREIWEGDEAAFMNFVVGLLQQIKKREKALFLKRAGYSLFSGKVLFFTVKTVKNKIFNKKILDKKSEKVYHFSKQKEIY